VQCSDFKGQGGASTPKVVYGRAPARC